MKAITTTIVIILSIATNTVVASGTDWFNGYINYTIEKAEQTAQRNHSAEEDSPLRNDEGKDTQTQADIKSNEKQEHYSVRDINTALSMQNIKSALAQCKHDSCNYKMSIESLSYFNKDFSSSLQQAYVIKPISSSLSIGASVNFAENNANNNRSELDLFANSYYGDAELFVNISYHHSSTIGNAFSGHANIGYNIDSKYLSSKISGIVNYITSDKESILSLGPELYVGYNLHKQAKINLVNQLLLTPTLSDIRYNGYLSINLSDVTKSLHFGAKAGLQRAALINKYILGANISYTIG